MPSSTCSIPCMYHGWELGKQKEIQIIFFICNVALSNCHACNNRMPKRPAIKSKVAVIKLLNYIWCVWMHACAIACHSLADLN